MSRVLAWAWVPGQPRTKGSLDPRKGGGLTDSAASTRWRAQIVQRVRAARPVGPGAPETARGAILIECLCFMPQSAAEAVDDIEPATLAPIKETTANGDIDKLARNLLDALAVDLVHGDERKGADVYRNDCQVTDINFRKLIEIEPYGVGALFRVVELEPVEIYLARSLAESMLWCAERGFLPPEGSLVPR